MIKAKINEFKVSIRRQQKDKIFAEMRKEQQHITQVQGNIERIYELELGRQNFGTLKGLFNEINQHLVEYSRSGSKGALLDAGKLFSERGDIAFNPLERMGKKYVGLTSQKFKTLVLNLLENVKKVNKIKIHNQWLQISEQLLFEITFMIGILFKQPVSLAILFPFKSITDSLQIRETEEDDRQQYGPQNVFQSSFELLEQSIRYLKKKFQSLKDQPLDMLILFLNILHCVTTVLQFFVVNNKKRKGTTMQTRINQDNQKITYLYNLLKSHNFQNYLQDILEEIVESKNQDNESDQPKQITIFISLISLIDKYLKFIEFGNFSIQTQSFSQKVKKFYSFTLGLHSNQKEQALQQQNSLTQSNSKQKNIHQDAQTTQLRVLFGLNSLSCQPLLSFTQKQIVPLCYEMIEFLLIRGKLMQTENSSYETVTSVELRTPLSQFYFVVLVAEQGERWMHFLQILTCLQQLVTSYDISLDEIMKFFIESDAQFSQGTIIKLFDDMCYCITTISGYFYNERHVFMESLVNLFAIWNQNSFDRRNLMWGSEFWIKISEQLHKKIAEIDFSMKGFENIEFIKYNNAQENHKESSGDVQIDSKTKNKSNYQVLTVLEDLRNIIDITVDKTKSESFDRNIEFDN